MIYLFVVMLFIPNSTDADGWIQGKYTQGATQYKTIAECEYRRAQAIEYAVTLPTSTLISKCASASDFVEYRSYGKATPPAEPNT